MSLSPENKALIERETNPTRARWWADRSGIAPELNRLLDAARQEGARGGEPVAWRISWVFRAPGFECTYPGGGAMLTAERPAMEQQIAHLRTWDRVDTFEVQPLYASPAEPSGWRPIESAPKDGTVIMAWRAGWGPCECRWEVDFDGDECSFAGWVDPNADDETRPTHWMPLPPPPTSEGGGA